MLSTSCSCFLFEVGTFGIGHSSFILARHPFRPLTKLTNPDEPKMASTSKVKLFKCLFWACFKEYILTFYLSVFCSEHCIAFSWPAGLLVVIETIKFLDSRRLIVQGVLGNESQLHRQAGQNQHLQGAKDPKMKSWVCCCFFFFPMKKWNRSAPFFLVKGITSLSKKNERCNI